MNKKCSHCQHEYPESSRYCPYCGKPNERYQEQRVQVVQSIRLFVLFLVGFVGFQIVGTLLEVPFLIKGIHDFGEDTTAITAYLKTVPVSMFINSVGYCIIFAALVFCSKPFLPTFLKSFKDKKSYLAGFVTFASVLVFSIFYSIFLYLIGVKADANENQTKIDSVVKVYPVICLIVFGLFGPICEELTYRVGLFLPLKARNKYWAYAVTIVVFTLIHFDFGADNMVNELLNIPFYAAAAFAFTYCFDKYGFAASVSAHIFNNLYSLITKII